MVIRIILFKKMLYKQTTKPIQIKHIKQPSWTVREIHGGKNTEKRKKES